jgi:hypothetical protein
VKQSVEWHLIAKGFCISLFLTLIAFPIAWVCVGLWGQRGLFVSYPTMLILGTLTNFVVHRWRRSAPAVRPKVD